jgi:hypothetical protein
MTAKHAAHPDAKWNPSLGAYLIPAPVMTVERFVDLILKRRADAGISVYRIAKTTGLTLNAVNRFFKGYRGCTEAKIVKNPYDPGKVRLETAMRIAQAVGLDLELVMRATPA